MDRSRHTVMKYLSDEKTHATINSKLPKKVNHVNNSLYEKKLAKTEIKLKETIIVGFFITKTQNSECWNCITKVSKNIVI